MPDPEQIYTVLSSQLSEVGVETTPVSEVWSSTSTAPPAPRITATTCWLTGDLQRHRQLRRRLFGQKSSEWGFDNPELFQKLTEARGVSSLEEQTPLYEEINEMVAEFIPASARAPGADPGVRPPREELSGQPR